MVSGTKMLVADLLYAVGCEVGLTFPSQLLDWIQNGHVAHPEEGLYLVSIIVTST